MIHQGLYRYTFEHRCLEREMSLGDETGIIFFNTKVKAIKQSRMLEERYMQFEEMLNKRETKGRKEGRTEGEKLKVIAQIVKKTGKGLPPEVIAEHLEEEVSFVQKVCEALREHPEATPEEMLMILS